MVDNIHDLNMQQLKQDQNLSAYIDGELSEREQAQLQQELASHPGLAMRLAEFQRNDALLKTLLHSKSDIPTSVTTTLTNSRNAANKSRPWFKGLQGGLAIAATLTLAIGLTWNSDKLGFNSVEKNGPPVMSHSLAQALEHNPSRAEGWDSISNTQKMRALLTFPAADGTWCREFLVASDASHWRGVACRHDNSWVTEVIGREVFLEQETNYRPASAQDMNKVARFIDQAATDVALGRDEETALLTKGWQ